MTNLKDNINGKNISRKNNIKNIVLNLKDQIKISIGKTYNRNNNIFLLKSIFVYLLLVSLFILFLKNNTISPYIIIILTIVFLLIILWIFYNRQNTNNHIDK